YHLLLAFFFQAEDGIRDRNVTGVQTCALPILFWLYPPNSSLIASEKSNIDSPIASNKSFFSKIYILLHFILLNLTVYKFKLFKMFIYIYIYVKQLITFYSINLKYLTIFI